MIECACGCKQKLKKYDSRGRERRYLVGHNKYWLGKKRDKETCDKVSRALTGRKMPQYVKDKISKANIGRISVGLKGKSNPRWKGGRFLSTYGYVLVYTENRGYVFEHRLIMEKHIGRQLKKKEIVHHVNGVKTDNRIENLLLLKDASEHKKLHKEIGLNTRFKKK